MNKLFFFFGLSLFALVPLHAQVKIKGELQFSDKVNMVFLSYRTAETAVNDSLKSNDGKFEFEAKIIEPTLANIIVRFEPLQGQSKPRTERMQIFLEPGKIKIEAKDSLKNAKISGSESHNQFVRINVLQKPYNDKVKALENRYMEFAKSKDSVGMKNITDEYKVLIDEMNEKVYRQYVVENSASPIALYILKQYAGYDIDGPKIEALFDKLSASMQKSPSGILFKEQIDIAKKTMVGAYAMEFTQNDTLGNPISLSSFKGKYVLVDFWASWCGPCRAENPNVVKAFNNYKDKGFTVLGVSLDQPGKQQAWLDAIHKDGLTWTHVSDLKYFNNAVAKQYGIVAIPQNILVDMTGKIVARNIKGAELEQKLKEIFN